MECNESIQELIQISFTCKLCGYGGQVEDDIKQHIKTEHNDNEKVQTANTESTAKVKEENHVSNQRGNLKRKCKTKNEDFVYYDQKTSKTQQNTNAEITSLEKQQCSKTDSCTELASDNLKFSDSMQCQVCKRKFKSDEDLTIHIDSHYGDKFKCVMCDYENKNWTQVKIHMETHNHPSTNPCNECGETFASSFTLYSHRRYTHMGGEHLCDECGFHAASKYILLQHQLSKHSNHQCCQFCPYTSDNQRDLLDHIKLRHENGFTCKYCVASVGNPQYKTKEDLNTHCSVAHPGSKHFFCQQCNYVAKLSHHLRKHMNVHTGAQPYACRYDGCNFRTKDHKNRKQHELTKHKKPGDLVCRSCSFVTTNQNEWDVHRAMYHMQEFKCDACDFKSNSQASIRRHRLSKHIPEDKMRYLCSYDGCSYITNLKENLQKHSLTHQEKDQPFMCPICRKTFEIRDNYKNHLQEHHPAVKIYVCEKCSFSTKNNQGYKRHILRHNATKSFHCKICRYKGRTKQLLQSHMKCRHNNHVPKNESAWTFFIGASDTSCYTSSSAIIPFNSARHC
uniref:zinc finger protein ZF(C2H2)-116 isoform X3 n=1 Tax=Ciona intestinalis TaxID=7719 RepID=UPI000EF4B2AE|nr:zinc finger protein ZF(C2H2)-116 isoform X3 [Ciona intestinalis]|eukprot:XP_026696248.1 zinc finger protein ZF(C2H2)-116 isoform X3 [Ciona intestinalis]